MFKEIGEVMSSLWMAFTTDIEFLEPDEEDKSTKYVPIDITGYDHGISVNMNLSDEDWDKAFKARKLVRNRRLELSLNMISIGIDPTNVDRYCDIIIYAEYNNLDPILNMDILMTKTKSTQEQVLAAVDTNNALKFLASKGYDTHFKLGWLGTVAEFYVNKDGTRKPDTDIEQIAKREDHRLEDVYLAFNLMEEYGKYREKEWSKHKEAENGKEVMAVQDIQGFLDFVLKEMKGTATEKEREIVQNQKGNLKKSIEILCAYLSNQSIFKEE